jgi:cell division protein FtsB
MLEGERVMKRLNCTVFDKRGVNGDCMEFHAKGKYLRYTEANAQVEALLWKCDKQEKRIAELEKERDEHMAHAYYILETCMVFSPAHFEAHNLEQQAKSLSDAHKVIVENKMLRSARDYIDFRASELLEMSQALKEGK